MSHCQICGKWGEGRHGIVEYSIDAGFGCFYYDWLCGPCIDWIDSCLDWLYKHGKIFLRL